MCKEDEAKKARNNGRILLVLLTAITFIISTIEMFFFEIFSGKAEYIYWYLGSLVFSVYLVLNKFYILFSLFVIGMGTVLLFGS
ncbi:hypothetical protein H0266_11020 [Halobacillus locisalis]|uniref:Uncharacterized protein n=1 Tax=Halobacillus locisalis TaxID=220753 RepID=A0A838CUY6_9BACI|nr:hypothetical protein [Halobacillus locisalis]MBA2175426.1 hypothetical protein [Halobacillus locisalis]